MREPGAWLWTRRQRGALAGIVLGLAVWLFVRALQQPMRVDDPPGIGGLADDLTTRIDPNSADWAAWAALPLIGEKRAKEIVAFREAWLVEHGGEPAFAKLEDLTRIRGIGKATIATLKPYLAFPEPAAGSTTRP
jgi:hypothetical protein